MTDTNNDGKFKLKQGIIEYEVVNVSLLISAIYVDYI